MKQRTLTIAALLLLLLSVLLNRGIAAKQVEPPHPSTRPATAPAKPEDDNPGPAGKDASAAWGLANVFMAQQDFAAKYPKKGSEVRGKAKDVFDVSFSPLDKAEPEIVVRVDLRNRQCSVVDQERSK